MKCPTALQWINAIVVLTNTNNQIQTNCMFMPFADDSDRTHYDWMAARSKNTALALSIPLIS